jgi:hypothetical protein
MDGTTSPFFQDVKSNSDNNIAIPNFYNTFGKQNKFETLSTPNRKNVENFSFYNHNLNSAHIQQLSSTIKETQQYNKRIANTGTPSSVDRYNLTSEVWVFSI